jgi:hypothetical protein
MVHVNFIDHPSATKEHFQMHKLFVALVFFLLSLSVHASCNLDLAMASGRYLTELEKAKLQEYQGGGACKILDGEFRKCTRNQKKKLSSLLDLKEVLGNICMPHLPPPPQTS